MAFFTKTNVWKIKQYTIEPQNVLGHGAYGIVYTARDRRKVKIAAKSIDGKRHPRILSQDLNNLKRLNHPNTLNIFDIHQEDQKVWMFMELCEFGDLNCFFADREVSVPEKLDIMKQVANGVVNLHAYDIIHRDIKPGNILIASDNPILAKLTDFDVTKFLDPETDVSMMFSNVGTNEFKAPEFFTRNEHGKISYHRNVDIFAMGVTYLAILQAKKENAKKLVPRMETALDSLELVTPIGLTLVTRKRYHIPNLNVVVLRDNLDFEENPNDAAMEGIQSEKVRKLIHQMTSFVPEQRPFAVEVHDDLDVVINGEPKRQWTSPQAKPNFHDSCDTPTAAAITKGLNSEEPLWPINLVNQTKTRKIQNNGTDGLEFAITKKLEVGNLAKEAVFSQTSIPSRQESHIELHKTNTWTTDMYVTSMAVNCMDQVLVRGMVEKDWRLRVMDRKKGEILQDLASSCHHDHCCILQHPSELNHILEGCTDCAVIRCYNVASCEVKIVVEKCRTNLMCHGTRGTFYSLDSICQLWHFGCDGIEVYPKSHISLNDSNVWGMSYVSEINALVLTSSYDGSVKAVQPDTGKEVWALAEKGFFHPRAVCSDGLGNILVAEEGRVLVFDGFSGELLRVLRRLDWIDGMCWVSSQPHLVVLPRGAFGRISCYDVEAL